MNVVRDGINEQSKEIFSVLLAGQSNMAGRGDFGEVPPIENERCRVLRMGRWQAMHEPINPDRSSNEGCTRSGVGLGASFADKLANSTGKTIGLIPCADGGTSIKQWQPGGEIFDYTVMVARFAMRTSNLVGIIWHQGESDCKNYNPQEYRELFLNTMRAFRRELGEDLPIVIGEICENITKGWAPGESAKEMNALLHTLSDELGNCAIVSAEGLSLRADRLHFNSASYRILGDRYFEKFAGLFNERV